MEVKTAKTVENREVNTILMPNYFAVASRRQCSLIANIQATDTTEL